jgi:UDP:flavonoid glycosyltransferase YjiC (YdhE family)
VTREVDPRFSPYLTIAFMAEALAPVSSCPRGVMFVGPHLGDGTDEHRGVQLHGAAGERLGLDGSARPLVLLDPGPQPTLSTVRLLALASQAVASMGARAALLTAESHRGALLERASVVVSHGEQATVHEALAHGVPLVLVPLGGEQPIVAAAAESTGAAIKVGFRDLRVDDLRLAIESAILDPMVLAGALRVRDACTRGGGTHTAADRIEELSAENVTTLARRASA